MPASKEEIIAFLEKEFTPKGLLIESVGNQLSRIRRTPSKEDLRPGNTVSGPFMMTTLM